MHPRRRGSVATAPGDAFRHDALPQPQPKYHCRCDQSGAQPNIHGSDRAERRQRGEVWTRVVQAWGPRRYASSNHWGNRERGQPDQEAAAGQHHHRPEHGGRRFVRVPSMVRPGSPQKDRSIDLHEARQRQGADQGQSRRRERCCHKRRASLAPERAEQAQKDEKLADEAVERRQAANGQRTDQEADRGPAALSWLGRLDGRSLECELRGSPSQR